MALTLLFTPFIPFNPYHNPERQAFIFTLILRMTEGNMLNWLKAS